MFGIGLASVQVFVWAKVSNEDRVIFRWHSETRRAFAVWAFKVFDPAVTADEDR